MKSEVEKVQNVDLLLSLNPSAVGRYLESHGWRERDRTNEKLAVWVLKPDTVRGNGDSDMEIALPLKPDNPGFPLHIYEAIRTLEQVEQRSSFQILGDLVTEAANIQAQGTIAHLETAGEMDKVTLLGCAIGKFRRMQLELCAERDRALAAQAYKDRLPVKCIGNLVNQDGTFVLKNPRDFALDEENL